VIDFVITETTVSVDTQPFWPEQTERFLKVRAAEHHEPKNRQVLMPEVREDTRAQRVALPG